MPSDRQNAIESRKDRWDRFKIVVESFIPFVALAWGILSWFLIRYHEDKAAQRQAQTALATMQEQRRVSNAQIAISLLPNLMKGTESERRSGLLILASVDPDFANRISSVLAANENGSINKELAHEVNRVVSETKTEQTFFQRLERARTFQQFQLYAQADREYISASDAVPARFTLDATLIRNGKTKYAEGAFAEAANIFEEAFRGISSQ